MNEQNKLAGEANSTDNEAVTEGAQEKVVLHESDLSEVAGGLILYPPYSKDGSNATKPSGCYFESTGENDFLPDHGNTNHVWWKCKGGCIRVLPDGKALAVKCDCKGDRFRCDTNGWHRFDKNGNHI